MSRRREGTTGVLAALAALVVLALQGCSQDGRGTAAPPPPSSSPTTARDAPTQVERLRPPAPPEVGACYDLDLEQALAASSDVAAGDCSTAHTSRTFLVGDLDAVVDGHLLAVDSDRVRDQVATRCPEALPTFVGGGADGVRLSVLRAVWFTPSLEESDAGAAWFRCDVVAVDGPDGLARLQGRLDGVLGTPAGRDRWGLCATGAPDADSAQRVPCAAPHSWRAVEVVPLGGGDYPGEDAVQDQGQDRCEAVGRERASDPLQFEWGYEWPTREQWEAGQTFGRCWVPD